MNVYLELVTKSNHPEYHLNHSTKYGDLKLELEALGYNNNNDYKIICERGYEMKEVVRLCKSKIKKDKNALEIIKKYLLTENDYNKLSSKMHYPMIKNLTAVAI
jgi:virulence-associated protein VapD